MKKTILITGGSSGIGYQATLSLISSGHKLIIPCKDENTCRNTLKKIKTESNDDIDASRFCEFLVMDLSDLNSVKAFAEKIKQSYLHIDCLILNAGLQYTGSKIPRRSEQGIELTFAINHLAHYFLTTIILNKVLKATCPRIIITSSEVHNPDSSGGRVGKKAGLGGLKGFELENEFDMLDGSKPFSADKAYKDSKLCNILFAKELKKRVTDINSDTSVIAWAPGLVIPRSSDGFFRYSRKYNELGQKIFAFIARDILRITETTIKAGNILAKLAISDKYKKSGFRYYSNTLTNFSEYRFQEVEPSDESKDCELANLLWQKSSQLISQKMN